MPKKASAEVPDEPIFPGGPFPDEVDDDPLANIVAVTEALGGYFDAKTLVLSPLEQAALWSVLERERTSRPVHDGLRGLLSLSHDHAEALLGLLRRVF